MGTFNLLIILLFFLNCFSELKPPAITFTQSQTAAEKQMIGEDREIEKDGWYISSIKTSAHGPDEWKKSQNSTEVVDQKSEDLSILYKIIAHTSIELKDLKRHRYAGEGLNGFLSPHKSLTTEAFQENYNTPEKIQRADDLINYINETRKKIYEIKESSSDPGNKDLRMSFYKSTEPGEVYEIKKNVWVIRD
ncbi:MAG: hypothetical protein H7A24_05455 [Leptospiraceae bacterium]|nr:hypothetical protein [Leptospiraceae bacterium]MCP5511304.1 hypothetical protein [Leptospiraceae bacterium]